MEFSFTSFQLVNLGSHFRLATIDHDFFFFFLQKRSPSSVGSIEVKTHVRCDGFILILNI